MGVLCCPALYCTVLCWTVLYCTALYCTVPYCAPYALPSIVAIPHQVVSLVLSTARIRQSQWYSVLCTALYRALYCTVLPCTVLHCTVLDCAILHCPVLHCTVLHSIRPAQYNGQTAPGSLNGTPYYAQPCTVHCIVLCCPALYRTGPCYTVLPCTALYCIVLRTPCPV